METYRQAFAGAPYFEQFSEAEVRQIWREHLQGAGCIIVAERDAVEGPSTPAEVVGLGCALPLMSPHAGGAGEFLLELRTREERVWTPAKTMYISELASKNFVRGQGIGTHLTQELLKWGAAQGFADWVTRTAAQGSNSLRIFERAGGVQFGPRHDVTAEGVQTSSSQRVYLEGRLSTERQQ